jgi:hypothetical protein
MSSHPERTSRFPDPALNVARSILAEAAQRPWLAALLMRRRPDWLTRLAQLALALRQLPRHLRRTLWRKLATGLAAAALLLALSGPQVARANTITVEPGCTLVQAIVTANDGSVQGSCAQGNPTGPDTINLTANVTLSAALPHISSNITIDGHGNTINGNATFRMLTVAAGAALTLQNATISGGSITGNGGGIFMYIGSTVTVQNSTISGNTATNLGGGIHNSYGTLTVQNSTISGNTATNGGGLNNFGGTVMVQNSTISGNTATSGGGIYNNFHGTMTVQNSTITGNTGPSGGGIYSNSGGTLAVQNSIVAAQISGADCHNPLPSSGGYNIESSTTCGFTNGVNGDNQLSISGESLTLSALANNGTLPHPFTHALVAPSVAAIDRIPNGANGCVANVSTDERGAVRAGGTNRGGTACDVGAYEVSAQSPSAVTTRDLMATTNAPLNAMGLLGALLAALGGTWIALRRHLKMS